MDVVQASFFGVALTIDGCFSVSDDDGGVIEGGCEPGVC